MIHLTEEELIDYHYGENSPGDNQRAAEHLASCALCSAAHAALREDLSTLHFDPASPQPEYSERLWSRLQPSLMPHHMPHPAWRRFGLRLAVASAALLLAAFFAGRLWEARHAPRTLASIQSPAGNAHSGEQAGEQSRERIIVLVLGEHLDRSERLLIELSHPREAASDPALQSTARELLTENRLYRQSARHAAEGGTGTANMQTLDGTLDDLQQLLVEIANHSKGLSLEEIRQIQKEMNTDALLFEVHVLHTRIEQQERGSAGSKGGTV